MALLRGQFIEGLGDHAGVVLEERISIAFEVLNPLPTLLEEGQLPARLPDHELIRLDATAHPDRIYFEHVEAARSIAGRTYLEDLRRISPAANAALSPELKADDVGP